MTARNTAALIAIVAVMIAGCGGTTAARRAGETVTPELVFRIVNQNHNMVRTMHGTGRISIETPELAQTGTFTFALKKPDSLKITIEGPFGIDLGAALITRKNFTFYNSFQNRAVFGETNSSNLARIFRLGVTFDDLLSFFAGGTILSTDSFLPVDLSSSDDTFTMTVKDPMGDRQYVLDPESLLITKIRQLDRSGMLLLEQEFADFRSVDGAVIPYRVRVTLHRDRRRAAVTYSDVDINEAVGDFTLLIPGSAERIELQ